MKYLAGRLLAFFRARSLDRDFDQELESHLVMLMEDYVSTGMTPDEARHAALLRLGGRTQLREAHREIRGMPVASDLIQDVQYTFRALRKSPTFAVIAVLTLALGIGANSAIFSVVNFVMLRPLPYRDPSGLVRIIENIPANESFTGRPFRRQSMDPEEALELRQQSKTLSYVAPYLPSSMVLGGGLEATVVKVAKVDPSLFSMLGVQPLMGSLLGTGEASSGIAHTVVLSYAAWLKYFAGDRNILGRSAMLDDTSYLVVGVMPVGFQFPDSNTSFWTRLDLGAAPGQVSLFA